MIRAIFNVVAFGYRSLWQWNMPLDDSAITTLADSKIGAALYKIAQNDKISFLRSSLKNEVKGFYEADQHKIILHIDSGFDTNAHEAMHNQHKKSNVRKKNASIKDRILKRLLHEAEAYAVQGLVTLEVYKESYTDPIKKPRIDTAIDTISSIYPNFKSEIELEHDSESKRELANKIFKAYLLNANPRFDKHLNLYSKWPTIVPGSLSIASNSAFVSGCAMVADALVSDVFNLGIKGHGLIIAFYTAQNLLQIPEKRRQSSFKTVFDQTDIGNIPTINGNYLEDIKVLDDDDPIFNVTLKKIGNHIDKRLNAFERDLFDAVRGKNNTVQKIIYHTQAITSAMPR